MTGGIQAVTAGDDVTAHALLDAAFLDLDRPSVSRQIDLLLHNLLLGRVTTVLITSVGSDSAASHLIEVNTIRPDPRFASDSLSDWVPDVGSYYWLALRHGSISGVTSLIRWAHLSDRSIASVKTRG